MEEEILTPDQIFGIARALSEIAYYLRPEGAMEHQATSAQIRLYIVGDRLNYYAKECQRWGRSHYHTG